MTAEEILWLQEFLRDFPVPPHVFDYVLSLVRATRTCGSRSSIASVLARSRSDPNASSATIQGWITIWPEFRAFCKSVLPERK